jgi:hypothetical protein
MKNVALFIAGNESDFILRLPKSLPSACRRVRCVSRLDANRFGRFPLALQPTQAHALQRIDGQSDQERDDGGESQRETHRRGQYFQSLHNYISPQITIQQTNAIAPPPKKQLTLARLRSAICERFM